MEDSHVMESDPLAERKATSRQSIVVTVCAGVMFVGALIAVIIVLVKRRDNCDNPPTFGWLTDETSNRARRVQFMGLISAPRIGELVRNYSYVPHIAGSVRNSVELASETAQHFKDYGFDEVVEQHIPVLLMNLSYRSVNLTDGVGTVLYTCGLEEEDVLNFTDWNRALPPSNGYAGSGVAEGPIVWANYGRESDFKAIENISLVGTIVVVRYGEIFRGDKVRLAFLRGAVGVLIVNDPFDVVQGAAFPAGPWARNSSVQRGSVYLGEGDPLTPSWPSEYGGPVLQENDLYNDTLMDGMPLPTIPVQPMGYGDAANVLANIGGGNNLPDGWNNTGFLSSLLNGIGPGPNRVKMEVRRDLVVFNITNVIATIYGNIEPDRTVLLGSHRDAWTYGAVDPISGHSVIQEMSQAFGLMHKQGWVPRRSLQVNSWDAEEWAIIGSIEYVEANVELLRQRGVAYFNLDTAVTWNTSFFIGGSPLLENVTRDAAAEVPLPDGSGKYLDSKYNEFEAVGSGSDHVSFIQLAGVPVVDANFGGGAYEAVYHSNYDCYDWVSNFADPGFVYHRVMGQFYGNVILRLLDSNVLPLDVPNYGRMISKWSADYYNDAANNFSDFSFLIDSVNRLQVAASIHRARELRLKNTLATAPSLVSPYELRAVNDIAMGMERVFLSYGKKETGQQWYKHVIFTPSAVDSYAATLMPLIGIGLLTKDPVQANFAIGRVAQFIRRAAVFVNSSSVMPAPTPG